MASVAGVVALLAAAAAVLLFLPAFQVTEVTVSGTTYTDQAAIAATAEPAQGRSVLLAPTGEIQRAAEQVPGVRTAEVQRVWPHGVQVSITEREPIAQLVGPDGSSAPVDADGVELPAEAMAGQDEALPTLTVKPDAKDPDAAAAAMTEVMGDLPTELRSRASDVQASTDADVTFTLTPEEGQPKTVVWGDARDADLKAQVVATLEGEPGTVIDVSSPVAPVTR